MTLINSFVGATHTNEHPGEKVVMYQQYQEQELE